jgi:hypothetical protein
VSLPRYRGIVLPAAQPKGEGAERCHWGPCEAGGWILPIAPREHDEIGAAFHPGCLAKMNWTRACE